MSQATAAEPEIVSELLQYLPAIYQEAAWDEDTKGRLFLGDFLLAFERILLGRPHGEKADSQPDPIPPGLEYQIAHLHELFDPRETPVRFLDWLASWAALTLRADLSEARKRALIGRIIPLYRIRGTKRYLEALLELYLDVTATVAEAGGGLQVGARAMIGVDTYVGEGPPYFFRVTLAGSGEQGALTEKQFQLARAVIELAKPAHTICQLLAFHPGLQIAVHSTVGVDTILVPS
jgi:phage tail-like protein